MKIGDWLPVAQGATDARDKLREAYAILTEIFVAEPTKGASHTWAPMPQLLKCQQLISSATVDLIQGLKGRTDSTRSNNEGLALSKAAPRKKSVRVIK